MIELPPITAPVGWVTDAVKVSANVEIAKSLKVIVRSVTLATFSLVVEGAYKNMSFPFVAALLFLNIEFEEIFKSGAMLPLLSH